jgi:hypothetical protein
LTDSAPAAAEMMAKKAMAFMIVESYETYQALVVM